jgi:tetratricopeptide (TPR) repeat protein
MFEGRPFVAMEYVDGPTLGEWIRKETRTWQEILGAYVAAGRGLAAAHELGFVHRDFKPHNVLIAADGRVQVMDFGLARWVADPTEAASWPRVDDIEGSDETISSLTRTGRVVGTPRYMSPEQHQGPHVDARSDQFCFCAALYEALYGVKPFGGGGVKRIGRRKVHGQLQPPPHDTKVPARIQRALERGLHPDPAARWPDMPALLAALDGAPSRWARLPKLTAFASAGVGMVSVLGVTSLAPDSGLEACLERAASIEQTWSDPRREAMLTRLDEQGLERAQWARVESDLDSFVGAWTREYQLACEQLHVEEAQSVELHELRVGCLERQRFGLDATIEAAGTTERHGPTTTSRHTASLPDPAACRDVLRLIDEPAPPRDAAVAARLIAARRQLAWAEALTVSGRFAEASRVLFEVGGEAEELGYGPLRAEVRLADAMVQRELGRPKAARTSARSAFSEALAARQPERAIAAAALLVHLESKLGRHVDADHWAETSWSLADAHGVGHETRALLLHAEAESLRGRGDVEGAGIKLAEASALLAGDEAPNALVAEISESVGMLALAERRPDEARRRLEEAGRLWRVHFGARHPTHARVRLELAAASLASEAATKALEESREVLDWQRHQLGPEHPDVADSLAVLGAAHASLGDAEAAQRAYAKALEIRQAVFGRNSPGAHALQTRLVLLEATGRP